MALSLMQKVRMDMVAINKSGRVNRENVMSQAHVMARFHFGRGIEREFTYTELFRYCLKALYNVIKVVEAGARDDFNIIGNYFGHASWDHGLVTRKSYYDTICIMTDYLKIIKSEYPTKAFLAAKALCDNCGQYMAQNIK